MKFHEKMHTVIRAVLFVIMSRGIKNKNRIILREISGLRNLTLIFQFLLGTVFSYQVSFQFRFSLYIVSFFRQKVFNVSIIKTFSCYQPRNLKKSIVLELNANVSSYIKNVKLKCYTGRLCKCSFIRTKINYSSGDSNVV